MPGTVTKPLGNMHYEVQVDKGITTRHVDQLKPSVINPDENTDEANDLQDVQAPPAPLTHVPQVDQPSSVDVDTSDAGVKLKVLPPRSTRNKPPDRLNL